MLRSELRTHLIIHCSIISTTGLLGFIANCLQIAFIARDKKQRNSVFGIILFSLSISNIIVSVVLLYRAVVYLLTLYLAIDILLSDKLVLASDLVIIFSVASSFFHVVYVAVLRVLALVFPLKIKRLVTKSRCKIILAFLWLSSIGVVVLSYFTIRDALADYLAIVTSCILVLAYSLISYRMYRQHGVQNNESTQRHNQQSDKDVVIYSIALTFIFCLCNLPPSLYYLVKLPPVMHYVNIFLYSVNPFLDTMLYFFASYCKRRRRENTSLRNESDSNIARVRGVAGSSETTVETSRI